MNKTIKLTVAQALIKFLDQQFIEVDGVQSKFVKGIFGIFGHGNVLGIGQALAQDSGNLIVHQGRNEQGMAHAAIGFAKQNKRRQIYACTSSVGPGAANMITAAATASANRIPLLLLPGDVFATRSPDPVLQQIEQEYDLSISTNDAFKAVSKYFDRINRPEQLMSAMINAMRVLTDSAQTGAVTISLPQDVQAQSFDFPEYFLAKRVHKIDRTHASFSAIEDAVKLIETKQKPIVICGGGVRYSDAGAEMLEFCERYNIPFAETQAGKSTVVSNHYLNLGGVGVTGALSANELVKQADLIIGIGTRYTDFTTGSKWIFQNPKVSFLNINSNRFDAYKLDALSITCDAKAGLSDILKTIKPQYKSSWEGEIAQVKQDMAAELDRLLNLKIDENDPNLLKNLAEITPNIDDNLDTASVLPEFYKLTNSVLTQTQVLRHINNFLGEKDIIVAAAGSLPGDLQRTWQSKGVDTYHLEYGYSCMGYEINASLGVKLACPDQEVYTLLGDGSYLMLHSELVTSIQENKKINILLFDNAANGCINNLQIGNGMDSFCTEFRFRNGNEPHPTGNLIPINFAQNAQSYGAKAYTVTTLQQLNEALIDARKQKVSTLIEIKVLPKTMVGDYGAWWNVGVAEVSDKTEIQQARKNWEQNSKKARYY